jgi:hypothetical protein
MAAIIESTELTECYICLQSSELRLPHLLTRLCPSPSGSGGGGGGSLACGRGVGESQFRREDRLKGRCYINVKQLLPTTPPHLLSMTMVQLGVSCSTSYSLYLAVTTTFLQQQVVLELFVPELFVPELFVPKLIISRASYAGTLSYSFECLCIIVCLHSVSCRVYCILYLVLSTAYIVTLV